MLPATGLALETAALAQITDNAQPGFDSFRTDFQRAANLAVYQVAVNVPIVPKIGG